MTDAEIFDKLFNGGKHSRHFLIKFTHATLGTICLVDNNEAVIYDGNTYKPSSFEYFAPDANGDGGELRITSIGNDVYEFAENVRDDYRLDVVGILIDGSEVAPILQYKHYYGSLSYSDGVLDFSLGSDDRGAMVFTPYKYDTETNAGNA